MESTMYMHTWEPSDEKDFQIPAPSMEIKRDEDGEIWLRFKTGRSFEKATITILMTESQLADLAAKIQAVRDACPQKQENSTV